MISWRMAAGWVAALVVATVLTWQIVGLADSQVGETPVAVAPSLATTSEATSTTLASTTSSLPGTTTSSSSTPTTTTTIPSTSPTSSSAQTTLSSTAAVSWSLRTLTTTGGVVVIRYRPGEVELQAATPAPGFSVEIDDTGPPRVRVEFESEDVDVRVEARWENGALGVEVDEDD